MAFKLNVHRRIFPFKKPFRITGFSFEASDTVVVELYDGEFVGQGEGVGVYYLGETGPSLLAQIESCRDDIEGGVTRQELQSLMPPGGARNAVDCALWDLECHRSGKTIWELTDISPNSVNTVMTIPIDDTPQKMAESAAQAADYPTLKIKLDSTDPVERMSAIRDARPDATLVIDANQGFSPTQLKELIDPFAALGVAMLEQPLPRGGDEALDSFTSPIPICADESCLHRGELAAVLPRYDMINIKLDKTGGLTEALALAQEAKASGKSIMVGNMTGTSLSMAPSFVVAQLCNFVDLDGPLMLKSDYANGMRYCGPQLSAPRSQFWGGMQ